MIFGLMLIVELVVWKIEILPALYLAWLHHSTRPGRSVCSGFKNEIVFEPFQINFLLSVGGEDKHIRWNGTRLFGEENMEFMGRELLNQEAVMAPLKSTSVSSQYIDAIVKQPLVSLLSTLVGVRYHFIRDNIQESQSLVFSFCYSWLVFRHSLDNFMRPRAFML